MLGIPFAVFCVLYLIGIAADLISTKIAISKGLREGNPILAKFKNPILVSGIVSLSTVVFAIIAANIESTTLHASIFCLIFGVYRVTLATLNIIKIRKASNKKDVS